MKYDSLDFKILRALQKDARAAFADIAKELNVPAGIVQARYNKMRKAGLIKGSTLILDMDKVGITCSASIGITALASKIEEVIDHINGLKLKDAVVITWITFGRYNISAVIFSKSLIEVHKIKQLIQQHPAVIEASINLNKNYYENYAGLITEETFKE